MELVKIPLSLILEWVCLLTAILLLRNAMPKFWRWFIFYLTLTVAIESYSFCMHRLLGLQLNTQWLYNLFLLTYIVFHLYIFYKIIQLPFIRNICLCILLLLIGAYIWEWNSKGLNVSFSTTNTLFNGAVITLSILYYYSLFKQEEPKNILKEGAFWFVTGCFLFYTTSTAVNAFFYEIVAYSKENHFPLRYIIINFLNVIMYSSWIKSFTCLRKIKTSSRQLY